MLPDVADFRHRGKRSMSARQTRNFRQTDPVGPFLHYLMAECGVSPHTLAAYRSDLMRFVRWRQVEAPWPLDRLDASSLSRYVEFLSQSGLAASSVIRHIASLLDFLSIPGDRRPHHGKRRQVARGSGSLGPTAGRAQPRRRRSASLCASAETHLGRRDRAILETLYATGCRASEVAGLRPVDLDLKRGSARCVGKGNKERCVPLGSRNRSSRQLSEVRPPDPRRPTPRDRDGLRVEVGAAAVADRPLASRQAARVSHRPEWRRQSSYAPAQLRDAFARRWRRPARRAGDARSCVDRHDPNLYSRRAEPAP